MPMSRTGEWKKRITVYLPIDLYDKFMKYIKDKYGEFTYGRLSSEVTEAIKKYIEEVG